SPAVGEHRGDRLGFGLRRRPHVDDGGYRYEIGLETGQEPHDEVVDAWEQQHHALLGLASPLKTRPKRDDPALDILGAQLTVLIPPLVNADGPGPEVLLGEPVEVRRGLRPGFDLFQGDAHAVLPSLEADPPGVVSGDSLATGTRSHG